MLRTDSHARFHSEHFGDIQAAFREVLKQLPSSSADDTLSTIIGTPRTPKPNRTSSSSTIKTRDNTPIHDGMRTPFSENSFMTVPKGYVPHVSPTLTATKKRGRVNGGDGPDETPLKRKRRNGN